MYIIIYYPLGTTKAARGATKGLRIMAFGTKLKESVDSKRNNTKKMILFYEYIHNMNSKMKNANTSTGVNVGGKLFAVPA